MKVELFIICMLDCCIYIAQEWKERKGFRLIRRKNVIWAKTYKNEQKANIREENVNKNLLFRFFSVSVFVYFSNSTANGESQNWIFSRKLFHVSRWKSRKSDRKERIEMLNGLNLVLFNHIYSVVLQFPFDFGDHKKLLLQLLFMERSMGCE